jgi:hypothetical protein
MRCVDEGTLIIYVVVLTNKGTLTPIRRSIKHSSLHWLNFTLTNDI